MMSNNCPVCNNPMSGRICGICGYDMTFDCLKHPTASDNIKRNMLAMESCRNIAYSDSKVLITQVDKLLKTAVERLENAANDKSYDFGMIVSHLKDVQSELHLLKGGNRSAEDDVKQEAVPPEMTAEEQYRMGEEYYYGTTTVPQNYQMAFEWYMKSAEQGYADAQRMVGYMYRHGKGVQKDAKKAYEWYMKAAEQGHVDAQYMVGYMYRYGKGMPQDKQKAFEWYKRWGSNIEK